MLSKVTEVFIGCDKPYNKAEYVLFGAPFDSTASYRPGSRFACKSMRAESYAIEKYSPYQNKDMRDTSVFDSGDLDLCIGDTAIALGQIESYVSQLLHDSKKPVMIGGEHLVTLAAVRAMFKHYPELYIIHFDAHADLRDDYLGTKYSHATVIRRVWDLLGDRRIYQYGIRSGDKSEFTWGAERVFTNKFNFDGIEKVIKELEGKPVYFTLDLDVLDPSIFPGTGTPEAGGVSFNELLGAIEVISRLNIVGFDMVELLPQNDQSGVSTLVACKLLREIFLNMVRKV